MHSLIYWAIGWIAFVLLLADTFRPAKQPDKVAARFHLWVATGTAPSARKQITHNEVKHHWCYAPAV